MNTIAQEISRELGRVRRKGDDIRREIELSYELGWELALEDPQESLRLTHQALDLARKHHHHKAVGYCHRNLAYLTLIDGNLKEALDLADEALAEFIKSGDDFGKATTTDILTHTYRLLGRFDLATDYAFQTLKLCQNIGYQRGEAYAYNNLGTIYDTSREPEKALKYMAQARQLFKDIGYEVGESWSLAYSGEILLGLEKYDEARTALEQALTMAYRHRIALAMQFTIAAMGRLLLDSSTDYSQALEDYQALLGQYTGWEEAGFQTNHWFNLGRFYVLLGNDDLALKFFKKCIRKAEQHEHRPVLVDMYKELAELFERNRRFKNALTYNKKYSALERELFNSEAQVDIKNMQLKYELEVTEQKNEIVRLQLIESNQAELAKAHAEVQRLKDRLAAENLYLKEEIKSDYNFHEIITRSPLMEQALSQAEQVAATSSTVLILGESGTGKELLARAVHDLSPRKDRPLVKVNCAAIPENLIESELFGHERGAFTDAVKKKPGKFILADQGTIFLDEVGELDLKMQAKLLRALQEGEIQPLGAIAPMQIDVRVIAATNRNLPAMVNDGTFREDLYYRLHVFPVHLPPLRDRKDDIPLLVRHFADLKAKKQGKSITGISPAFMDALCQYDWPGNIRELENSMERAVILCQGGILSGEPPAGWHIQDDLARSKIRPDLQTATSDPKTTFVSSGVGPHGQPNEAAPISVAETLHMPNYSPPKNPYGDPQSELAQPPNFSASMLNSKASTETSTETSDSNPRNWSLQSQEKELITKALEKTNWVIKGPKGAAYLLGIPASTLRDKIKRYEIERRENIR